MMLGPGKHLILLIIFMGMFLLILSGCSTPRISPMLRVTELDIDGDVDFKGGGIINSSTSASKLGLDEETVLQPRVDLDWERSHLLVEGFQVEYDGSGVLNNSFTIGGNTIPFNTPVSSDWEFGFFRTAFTYDFFPIEFFQLGLGGGLGMLTYDMEMRSQTSGARVFTDDDLFFAFLTARAYKEFGQFDALVLLSGLSADIDDDDMAYFDTEASVGYQLFGDENLNGRIMAGYRYINVVYEYSDKGRDVELDADFDGPFLGFSGPITMIRTFPRART
jgi:hypothetical protein